MPTSPSTPTFGSYLRKQRQSAGMTQEELAERAHLSVETISALERGINHSPRPDTVGLLAEALHLLKDEREDFEGRATHAKAERPTYHQADHAPVGGLDSLVLCGRATELDAMRALIERPVSGAIAYTGRPGIGRTRMLREAEAMARADGHLVLSGTAYSSLRAGVCEPVLSALLTHLTALPEAERCAALDGCTKLFHLAAPESQQGRETLARFASSRASDDSHADLAIELREVGREIVRALSYLRRRGGARSLVLLVDDFQWVGASLTRLLGYLLLSAAQPGLVPVHLICTVEQGPVRHGSPAEYMLADLARSGLLAVWHLDTLTQNDAATLVADAWRTAETSTVLVPKRPAYRALTDRIPDAVLRQTLVCAGGIPFYLVELARAARQGWSGISDGVPTEVVERCRRLVDSLPEAPGELLRLVALSGPMVSSRMVGVLASVCGWSPLTLVSAFDDLCQRGLLAIQGESYYFRDRMLRRVLEASVGPALRDVACQMLRQGEAQSLAEASGTYEDAQHVYSATAGIPRHSFTS